MTQTFLLYWLNLLCEDSGFCFLRYNWHNIILVSVICCIYYELITTVSVVNICHHAVEKSVFLVTRTYKTYSLNNFQMCKMESLTRATTLYVSQGQWLLVGSEALSRGPGVCIKDRWGEHHCHSWGEESHSSGAVSSLIRQREKPNLESHSEQWTKILICNVKVISFLYIVKQFKTGWKIDM